MKEKLFENKTIVEEGAYSLWKGRGADVDEIGAAISSTIETIGGMLDQLSDEDKVTTATYIKDSFADYENARKNRDDFLLADCLYYEWREIILIFLEFVGGII